MDNIFYITLYLISIYSLFTNKYKSGVVAYKKASLATITMIYVCVSSVDVLVSSFVFYIGLSLKNSKDIKSLDMPAIMCLLTIVLMLCFLHFIIPLRIVNLMSLFLYFFGVYFVLFRKNYTFPESDKIIEGRNYIMLRKIDVLPHSKYGIKNVVVGIIYSFFGDNMVWSVASKVGDKFLEPKWNEKTVNVKGFDVNKDVSDYVVIELPYDITEGEVLNVCKKPLRRLKTLMLRINCLYVQSPILKGRYSYEGEILPSIYINKLLPRP